MNGYPLSDEKRRQFAIHETALIWTKDSTSKIEMNIDLAREIQQVIYKKNRQIELLVELAEACAMNGLNRGPGWTPAQHARLVLGQIDNGILRLIDQKERLMRTAQPSDSLRSKAKRSYRILLHAIAVQAGNCYCGTVQNKRQGHVLTLPVRRWFDCLNALAVTDSFRAHPEA